MDRRTTLASMCAVLSPLWGALPQTGMAAPTPIRLNLPGPNSLSFLPLELIVSLGLDVAHGAVLQLRYFPSGVLAFEDMVAGNANYAAHGFAILPDMKRKAKAGVAIASLTGSDTPIALIVRQDLAKQIRSVRDLKGRSIGVSTGSTANKTYLQLMGESILRAQGISGDAVRWIPMAQNWESVSGVFTSKSADAVLAEEPFATRLMMNRMGSVLVAQNHAAGPGKVDQAGHFRTVVSVAAAQRDAQDPERALLLKLISAAQDFIARTPAAATAKALKLTDKNAERELESILNRYKALFAANPGFPSVRRQATADFLQNLGLIPTANPSELVDLIDDRWSGSGK